VDSAHDAALSATILVDAKGRTLYALSGETTRHLECTSAQCLKFWPMLTVASSRTKLKAGAGVKGKLGLLKRPGGIFQVTLRGLPLYRFLGDTSAGTANGQLIASFGGVWHVVGAASGVVTTAPMTQTTTSSSSSSSAPGPAYPVQSTATTGASGAPSGATSTTSTSQSTSVSTSVSTASSTTTTCTPYYIGPYYYPCPA
jgi:predicted lipoprotein with Yx(FWY)xxD motif